MRVHVKVANKDHPGTDIKKGDTYYIWAFFRQRPQKSKTYPKRSQLTQDEGKQKVYDAYDSFSINAEMSAEDVKSAIEDLANELTEAASLFEEKFENIPEGLQQGDVGQNIEANKDACESSASDLESLASDVEDQDNEEYWTKEEEGSKTTLTLDIDAITEAVNGFEPELQ
jgi:polyhydroxyalkanoate synthesis regulator phasin